MARNNSELTRSNIVQVVARRFLEDGYTDTSVKAIAKELDISTGHVTYFFATKEHMLARLVEMLCHFQWDIMRKAVNEGNTSIRALCLELATMAAACDKDPVAKDFFLSSYTHPITLDIIRKNDVARAKEMFGSYCTHWSDEHYDEAEILVSGIEYATLMTTDDSVSLDRRVAASLESILTVYNVPPEVRREKIDLVLSMDYRSLGMKILKDFKVYVDEQTHNGFMG